MNGSPPLKLRTTEKGRKVKSRSHREKTPKPGNQQVTHILNVYRPLAGRTACLNSLKTEAQTTRSYQDVGARTAQVKKMGIPHGRERGAHWDDRALQVGMAGATTVGNRQCLPKLRMLESPKSPPSSGRICTSKACVHSSTVLQNPSAGQTKSPSTG